MEEARTMGSCYISIGMRLGTHQNILNVELIGFQSSPEKISIAHLIPEAHFVIYLYISSFAKGILPVPTAYVCYEDLMSKQKALEEQALCWLLNDIFSVIMLIRLQHVDSTAVDLLQTSLRITIILQCSRCFAK